MNNTCDALKRGGSIKFKQTFSGDPVKTQIALLFI